MVMFIEGWEDSNDSLVQKLKGVWVPGTLADSYPLQHSVKNGANTHKEIVWEFHQETIRNNWCLKLLSVRTLNLLINSPFFEIK